MPEFTRIASISEIPEGEGRSFEITGRKIAVFNVGGEFHAIDDVCVHRGGPLGEGALEGCVVTCPWHGWQFDVTTGRNPGDADIGVPTYPCRVRGEDLEIEL